PRRSRWRSRATRPSTTSSSSASPTSASARPWPRSSSSARERRSSWRSCAPTCAPTSRATSCRAASPSCRRSRATPPARRSTPGPRSWPWHPPPDSRQEPEMRTPLCEEFGIDYPIFAFTPSEHVAAAVSRAGGLGVLGCVRFNDPDELEQTLTWMDENTDGKPYGVDVVMPMKIPTEGTSVDLGAMIPEEHKKFVDETLLKLGVPPLPEGEGREGVLGWLHSVARSHVDIALQHRPVLIANALGSPPVDVIEKAHEHGVKVAALAGAAKHALSHVANGVDIIVAQGYEAGGHTGEIAGMVLTPDIVDAVGDVPVLGAGGIGSGRQVAASLALGAQGVWTGSIWLGTEEYQNLQSSAGWTEAFTRATSSDTVRTRIYT